MTVSNEVASRTVVAQREAQQRKGRNRLFHRNQDVRSAAVRLSIIGQTQGQRALAALAAPVAALGAAAAQASRDDLGSAAFRSDIASMRHETQYSRLFRS